MKSVCDEFGEVPGEVWVSFDAGWINHLGLTLPSHQVDRSENYSKLGSWFDRKWYQDHMGIICLEFSIFVIWKL